MSVGILARVAGAGDARGQRSSVRRVLALVGGRAQPHVLLRVRGDLALDLLCRREFERFLDVHSGPVSEPSYKACESTTGDQERTPKRFEVVFGVENP